MRAARVIPPGRGEIVGDAPERRVEILSDHDSLHATWSRYGPHRDGADLHVHRHHVDLFYVLEGEFTLRLGIEDEAVRVPAGTLARIPPLVVHGFRNASDAEIRYLNFHAPGMRFADFMRAMRDGREFSYDQHPPPPDGGRPTAEAVIGHETDIQEISVAEVRCDPHGRSAPPRPGHLSSIYVLEGEIALTTGDRELRAAAGSWLQLPPGTPHAVASAEPRPARYLDIRTPV